MNGKLQLAQDRFIETIGNLCNKFGLNNFMAQLYAVLYLSNEPLSLDDLAQRLEVSKGNVSINIRELERWRAVTRVWVKGSRRDFYRAETDLKKILAERFKTSFHKHMSEVSDMMDEFNKILDSVKNELSEEEKKIVNLYKQRLGQIENIKSIASKTLNLVTKIL